MNIDPQEVIRRFPQWKVQEDAHGFSIYTKADFDGCIRQNGLDGITEVFGKPAKEIIAQPVQPYPWFTVYKKPESDGYEEFEKAALFIDTISNA